ncbi:MAG: class II aldolase [Chloroflexi bacterium]|nr:class II aldolase [Chloroflexota bacterium]
MTSTITAILSELIQLSNHLGDPVYDYAILGEGNSSVQIDEECFWVKASGAEMRTAGPDGFVQVRFAQVLAMLDGPELSDAAVRQALTAAKMDADAPGHPSVETALHAACLELPGVNFVGHTHPTAINMITCSVAFTEALSGRLFPDEIVACGPAPVLIPYTDPGLPLAREVRARIHAYLVEYGEPPRVLLLQNHGLFALGATATQVENITAMMVKTARVLVGTYAMGGPHFMSTAAVNRIYTRPDEHYRQAIMTPKDKE